MAVLSRAVNVGLAATRLDSVTGSGEQQFSHGGFCFYNGSAVTVYCGGPDVTTANGFPVLAGAYGPGIDIGTADTIYAVVASTTSEVRVIEKL